MANEKIMMPTSTAGITRYFEDYKSKIEFSPGQVIIVCMVVLLVTLLLHVYGGAFLGLA